MDRKAGGTSLPGVRSGPGPERPASFAHIGKDDNNSAAARTAESGDSPVHRSAQLPSFADRLPWKAVVAVAAAILVAGLATVASKEPSGSSHTLTGTFRTFGAPLSGAANGPGLPCRAPSVSAGDPVIVTDQSRRQIALGSLYGEGVSDSDITYCHFTFTMTVPDTGIYYVQVGDHSTPIAFTRAEMAANGWKLAIDSSG